MSESEKNKQIKEEAVKEERMPDLSERESKSGKTVEKRNSLCRERECKHEKKKEEETAPKKKERPSGERSRKNINVSAVTFRRVGSVSRKEKIERL